MSNRGDIHELGELLEAMRTRHTMVFYMGLVLSALGVLGLICLFNAIFPVKVPQ